MKKQFLFLILFVAAIVAGTSKSYGQQPYQDVFTANNTDCLIPTPLGNCTADHLHPVQGQTYTYTVNASSQTDVRWFVVNNTELLDTDLPTAGYGIDSIIGYGGVLISSSPYIDPSTGAGDFIYGDGSGNPLTGYNVDPVADATGQFHSIDISWKYFDGITNQVLLVAYAEDSVGCTNNLEVYRIIPEPAFTIDIAVLNDAGDSIAGPLDPVTGECVSEIESAVYSGSNTTPDGTLTVDYGENWVFYKVNGANYFDSWMPEFLIDYNGGTAPTVEASWAYLSDADDTDPAVWHALTGSLSPTAAWTTTVPVVPGATHATEGTTGFSAGEGKLPADGGECIVVRVRLDWGTLIEHDDATGILTFAANGTAYDDDGSDMYDNSVGGVADSGNFEDLHYADCNPDGFANDVVDYNITPRPEVENAIAAPVDTETKTGDETN